MVTVLKAMADTKEATARVAKGEAVKAMADTKAAVTKVVAAVAWQWLWWRRRRWCR